ncbi:hypothetical protein LINPERHAP2_LOCUS14769 [Linum perenne]
MTSKSKILTYLSKMEPQVRTNYKHWSHRGEDRTSVF